MLDQQTSCNGAQRRRGRTYDRGRQPRRRVRPSNDHLEQVDRPRILAVIAGILQFGSVRDVPRQAVVRLTVGVNDPAGVMGTRVVSVIVHVHHWRSQTGGHD